MDCLTLDQTLEGVLLQARSLSELEQRMDIIALSLDNLFSSHADDKEEVKDLDFVAAIVLTTEVEVDAPRAEANKAEVVDENITSQEANEAEEDDDEDDDNEDDHDSPTLQDAGKDLGGDDDEDDNDEDFTIQYHKPANAVKGVSLRDSSSEEEKEKEKEKETSTKNQDTASKDKGVAEEGNLKVLFKSIVPQSTESSRFAIVTSFSQLSYIPSTTCGRLEESARGMGT
ncbi:nucleolin-like [Cynara cardunculus var. scolymus]|uniref:nucleolin-like n=1 Tax=Cynara cardunculus var. scolymus TaxID=59895 RepID=UPI000D62C817|nr:nucleolin-like [Cynara cardunculus var. scolymus]